VIGNRQFARLQDERFRHVTTQINRDMDIVSLKDATFDIGLVCVALLELIDGCFLIAKSL
ncbi:uncharacterized protein METZ01_LOCUS171254, partial [marine metagenome]